MTSSSDYLDMVSDFSETQDHGAVKGSVKDANEKSGQGLVHDKIQDD